MPVSVTNIRDLIIPELWKMPDLRGRYSVAFKTPVATPEFQLAELEQAEDFISQCNQS